MGVSIVTEIETKVWDLGVSVDHWGDDLVAVLDKDGKAIAGVARKDIKSFSTEPAVTTPVAPAQSQLPTTA